MPETLLEIGPDTGDLPIPTLASGHEWQSARLQVRAEPTVTLTPTIQIPGGPAEPGPWVSVDWGAMRPLTALRITWSQRAPAFVVMKVATGGVWFTPVPPGRVHPKTYQPVFAFPATRAPNFPPVIASALLLELRASDPLAHERGEPDEVSAAISQVTVTVQNPVIDLQVAIGDGPPVFTHKGRLGQPLDQDLVEALRAAPRGATLRLRAATTATLTVTWEPLSVARPKLPPREPPTRNVALADPVRWTQDLGEERIAAASGRLEWHVEAERMLLAPEPPPELALAQAVFPGQDAAQSLGTLAAAPVGVDLWLASVGGAAGTLALVGERSERPTDKPLAACPWSLAPGEARWHSVPAPAKLSGPLWLVCRANEGEALLARAVLPGAPPVALQRRNLGPWSEVDEPDRSPHLHLRVRAHDPGQTPAQLTVRRGDMAVTLASVGAFALTPGQIETLNKADGSVTLEVTAPGSGTVTLAAWELRLAPTPG